MSSQSTASRSRAWVEVDLSALRRNAHAVLGAAAPAGGLIPMVKANAYGLGVGAVADALIHALGPRLWGFGVATVGEGVELRALGWNGRVLVFSPAPPAQYDQAAAAGLTLCLSRLEDVRRWRDATASYAAPSAFHTEIDTGMGRSGFAWSGAAEWGRAVARLDGPDFRWEGCFTHFHSADEPGLQSTDEQWERFQRALEALPSAAEGEGPRVVHVANSAAALRRCGYGCDLVRPGVFLYGGRAGPETNPEPVVSLRARVALIREVPRGCTLGYGATYHATRDERWGTLSIGYGDGLPRSLAPAGGDVIVRGRRVPMIGRISMDVTVVDLTDLPDAEVGDVATVVGRDGAAEITIDEVASLCGTISYEILTGLTARLPREYQGARAPAGIVGHTPSPPDRTATR